MAKTIIDYMAALATDQNEKRKYKDNPRKAAKDFGLSDEDADIAASGDKAKIRDAMVNTARTMAIVTG